MLSLETKNLENGVATLKRPNINVKTDNKSIVFWVGKENKMEPIQSTGGCLWNALFTQQLYLLSC